MTGLIGDLRYGLRGLLRNRSLALVGILSLALGIGANTTIFTLLNAVFLRSMPVQDPSSLAALVTLDSRTPGKLGTSYPNYRDLRDQNAVFSSLLLYAPATVSLTGRGDPQLLMIHLVSPNYFQTLGLRLLLGRPFDASDDGAPGSVSTAIITESLWRRVYSADPQVTSRTIELNGRQYQIVGVAPRDFNGLNQLAGADVFLPFATFPQVVPTPDMVMQRRALIFAAAGRLKAGVTLAQAEAALQPLSQELERQFTENRGRRIHLIPLAEAAMNERTRPVVSKAGAILMAISGVVLLIACGNVASLLLARATSRNREIAIRLAMGAARSRLVRQLLTESLLLATIGGAAGLVLARWARDLLWWMRPPAFKHTGLVLELDSRVLLFTLAVSVVTGVVFGLVPALRATAPDLASDLKERGSASGGLTRVWTARSMLVIAQVALSLVALVGAGLFLRSLQNATAIDTGFDTPHLGIVSYNLTDQGYTEVRGRDYHQRAVERANSIPGVASAALSRDLPFHVTFIRGLVLAGQEPRATLTSVVYPAYFQTMRIPLLRGRDFTATDSRAAPHVVIVNQAAAAVLWPGEEPIGKTLTFAGDGSPFEVVGVARNANYRDIGEPAKPLVYLSMLQFYFPTGVMYVRSATSDPAPVIATVKRELQQLDPKLLLQAETIEVSMRDLLWVQRLSAGLLALFGLLALVLSTIGIYGVVSYSVRQRTREIGVRLAMGATTGDLERLILREGIRLVAIGVIIGSILAVSSAGAVSSLLLRNPWDVATFMVVPSILVLVGLIACWAPARRATRIDPSRALRDE